MARMRNKKLSPISVAVGIRTKLFKKLNKLNQEFLRYVYTDILQYLDKEKVLVFDASPLSPQEHKLFLKFLKTRFQNGNIKTFKSNKELEKILSDYVAGKNLDYLHIWQEASRRLVSNDLKRIMGNVCRQQKQELIKANFNEAILAERWSTPTVSGQYVSPQGAEIYRQTVEGMQASLSKMAQKQTAKMVKMLTAMAQEPDNATLVWGGSWDAIQKAVKGKITEKELARIVISETNRLNAEVQRANAKSIGITRGVWIHRWGQFTYRPTHKAMNGQEFDLDVGIYDSDVGRNVKPAELAWCRCGFRLILDTRQNQAELGQASGVGFEVRQNIPEDLT